MVDRTGADYNIGLSQNIAFEDSVGAHGHGVTNDPNNILRECAADQGDVDVRSLLQGSRDLEYPS
jgi:hypothetical protein